MSDHEKPQHDAFDRQVVDPNDGRYVEANRNRVNQDDFGVVSSELTSDELERSEAPGELPENDTQRKAKAEDEG